MPRLPAIPREELVEHESLFLLIEERLGFLPNSTLTLAHRPKIMHAFHALTREVMGAGEVDDGLKRMVASVVSNAAVCRYCHAHTTQAAEVRALVPPAKVAALYEFEDSELFDAAEKAALRVARGAGTVPNEVTDADLEELQEHFTISQCVEIVAVIGVFGFLNRWNDTVSTELEQSPLAYAQKHLDA